MKLDGEDAEWEVFRTSTALEQVETVAMELPLPASRESDGMASRRLSKGLGGPSGTEVLFRRRREAWHFTGGDAIPLHTLRCTDGPLRDLA